MSDAISLYDTSRFFGIIIVMVTESSLQFLIRGGAMKRVLVSNGNPMETVVGFCRAVRVGPYISVGGTAPVDSEGITVGVGDPAAQARRCLEIIKGALENAGSGLKDVIRTRVLPHQYR